MAELLVELLSEEIPARMQARAADDLRRLVTDGLRAAQLAFESAESHVTPRRLALVVRGLPERQEDVTEERKGPRVGAPEPAIQGFLRAAGLERLEQCEQREIGKAVFWFAVRRIAGRPTREVLPELLVGAIRAIPWPKSMRWADTTARYVRPLHNVLALFDGRPLDGGYPVGGTPGTLAFDDATRGHRFLAPEPFRVRDFEQYRDRLRSAFVILDAAERREIILREARRIAADEGLRLKEDEGLLQEVAGLVEWPVVLAGSIDAAFMAVPPEVLTTTMRANQKYFSLLKPDGSLAPRFVLVANMQAADGGRAIVAGNERVLRARLSDAKFFWDQDRKVRLEERIPALGAIIFHAKLGTVGQKALRLSELALAIAELIRQGAARADRSAAWAQPLDPEEVGEAAWLAKADLVTGMVGEFPELQGVMGRYYALEEGLPAAVADAIAEHYAPQGPNDRCPTAPVSVVAALADKIDTLVGFFAIGEKPTGSRDPYALRRAALGVIRLVLENGLRLPLRAVFAEAWRLHEGLPADRGPEQVSAELLDFFADRLKVHLREEGVRHDLIAAIFSLGDEDDLVRLLARVEALAGFVASEDGANLLTAFRRASNIVAIEEKKDGVSHAGPADPALLRLPEEQALHAALDAARRASAAALACEDFAGAMARLAALRPAVDAFFDRVTVNAPEPDLRANRLKLLSEIRATMGLVADFSKAEG